MTRIYPQHARPHPPPIPAVRIASIDFAFPARFSPFWKAVRRPGAPACLIARPRGALVSKASAMALLAHLKATCPDWGEHIEVRPGPVLDLSSLASHVQTERPVHLIIGREHEGRIAITLSAVPDASALLSIVLGRKVHGRALRMEALSLADSILRLSRTPDAETQGALKAFLTRRFQAVKA